MDDRSLEKEGTAGVRPGCVFSPQISSSVLHWAKSKWRTWAEGCSFGFGPGDGLPPLLNLFLKLNTA